MTESIYRSVGLELAVRAWLRGTPGVGRSFRNCAISIHTAAMHQDYDRLVQYGVPDKVLASGVELAAFLAKDEVLINLWKKTRLSSDGPFQGTAETFQVAALKCIESRFNVSAKPIWQKGPGLVLTPREHDLYQDAPGRINNFSGAAEHHVLPDLHPSDQTSKGAMCSSAVPTPRSFVSNTKAKVGMSAPVSPQSTAGRQSPQLHMGMHSHIEDVGTPSPNDSRPPRSYIPPHGPGPLKGIRKLKKGIRRTAWWDEPEFLGCKAHSRRAESPRTSKTETTKARSCVDTDDWTSPRSRTRIANVKKNLNNDQRWKSWLENDNCLTLEDFYKKEEENASSSPNSPKSSANNTAKSMHSPVTQRAAALDGVQSALAENLNESKMGLSQVVRDFADMHRIFTEHDVDGSGQIELAEFPPLLGKLMRRPASSFGPDEIIMYWKEIDRDGDETISQEEMRLWFCTKFMVDSSPDFSNFFCEQETLTEHQRYLRELAGHHHMDPHDVEEIHKEFKRWDVDNSGFIDYSEFLELLATLLGVKDGSIIPENRGRKFFAEIDDDHSGLIELEEFVKWYAKYFGGELSGDPLTMFYNQLGVGWLANWRINKAKADSRPKTVAEDPSKRETTVVRTRTSS